MKLMIQPSQFIKNKIGPFLKIFGGFKFNLASEKLRTL